MPLLEIRDVWKRYGDVVAVQDLNLTVERDPASIVTIAGESGSGKSTLANLVLGFTKASEGSITFDGMDLATAGPAELKEYRRNVQAVFQDPFGVYNPFYRIQHVFDMVIRNFGLAQGRSAARDLMEEGLNAVGLYGDDVLRKYPHQLSGGQRQRIMMARAYMVKPKLIVADEPVSMVDASLRASILDVMMKLRDEGGISFLYITHDLSTAYQIGDRIMLFYQGTVAEQGNAVDVISNPQHPYVQLLVESVPKPDPNDRWVGEIELPAEEEMRTTSAAGCRFYPRCPVRMDRCRELLPPLYPVGEGHRAACFLHETQRTGA
ncbi:MAG: ABC transporter ATP-binding protein [Pseudomonadota bacterium]